jgi:DNA repair protein RecO (recombination protein O)
MSRENKYTAIILKKQPFNEGDEIITLYTKEAGKIRALAKAVKMPKSKLQQKLQALFLVELTLTDGSKLPKIIGVEPVKTFGRMRETLMALKTAICALELVLKFTADEHKNERLFISFAEFLEFLDTVQPEEIMNLGLAKFKIDILELSGLGVGYPSAIQNGQKLFFSPIGGGFSYVNYTGAMPVSPQELELFLQLLAGSFPLLANAQNFTKIESLQNLLSRFIEHQLEREIKSEKYIAN